MNFAVSSAPIPDLTTDFAAVRDRMVGYLERMRHYATTINLGQQVVDDIDRVLERTRSDSFVIAVVGEFKRGKSTFINALLGQAVLPADVLPATAAINRVRYGSRESVQVIYRPDPSGQRKTEQVSVAQLADYVTNLTDESTERAQTIEQAIVTFPLPFLEHNEIVDTPGLNDSREMSEVTYRVLPEADAAIMLVTAVAPFGQTEASFLNFLLTHDVGRVIFVVNQIDKLRKAGDKERIIVAIAQRIRECTSEKAKELFGEESEAYQRHLQRIGRIQIFGVSAKQALSARQGNNAALLEESGFSLFEDALKHFLNQQRGSLRLKIMSDRLVTSGALILQTVEVRAGALSMSQARFDHAYEESSASLRQLSTQLEERLARLDGASDQTRRAGRTMLLQLGNRLHEVAGRIIDETPMSGADLDPRRLQTITRDVRQAVQREVEQTSQTVADQIQLMIMQELAIELDKLRELAGTVDASLQQITLDFGASPTNVPHTFASSLTSRLSGRLLAAGGVATLMAVGLPVVWPILLVVAIASTFGGDWLSRRFFAETRVDQFKQRMRSEIFASIDARIREQSLEMQQQLDEHVRNTFAQLKLHAQQELSGAVEQMQRTVEDLREQRMREAAVAERDLGDLKRIGDEVARMLADVRTVISAAEQVLNEA